MALAWLFSPASLRPAAAAPINFGPPTTVANDNDIFLHGTLRYAYNLANANSTVNGVLFTGANSISSLGGGNVTLSGYTANNTTAFGSGAGGPCTLLPWPAIGRAGTPRAAPDQRL